MAISIKDAETDRLARALVAVTGESLTEAIKRALHERLERESHRTRGGIDAEVRRIQERVARLPIVDSRAANEILGYDEHGLPR
jgi:antitoxin VapB